MLKSIYQITHKKEELKWRKQKHPLKSSLA
jgi:hypothetical protein